MRIIDSGTSYEYGTASIVCCFIASVNSSSLTAHDAWQGIKSKQQ